MAPAICRLCQWPRALRDSHFIPAAFYYHLGLDETGTFQNQALQKLTRSRFARVPGQIKKHLLCDECEQRLNANGESWVTRFAHQVGRSFRLQEALLQLGPRLPLATGRIYYAEDDPEGLKHGRIRRKTGFFQILGNVILRLVMDRHLVMFAALF